MTPLSDRLPANCLAHIAQANNHAVIIAVLRESEVARQSSFSLMEEDDYALLAREVAKDFPYLTVENLEDAMMLGVKGKLDTYKSRPLNFTRVYQWVEQRAKASKGYWRHYYPEWMAWARIVLLEEQTFAAIFSHPMQEEVGNVIGTLISIEIHKAYLSHPDRETNVALRLQLEAEAKPALAAQYPTFAALHPSLF
jgi:hypothetical protein